MNDHVKYQHPDNMDNLIGNKEENMQDLPSRVWVHSIWDRKCKRPECGDHKQNPTELRYHYRRAHPLDSIEFKDGDMNRCIRCGVYMKSTNCMIKHQTTKILRNIHYRNRKMIQNKIIRS